MSTIDDQRHARIIRERRTYFHRTLLGIVLFLAAVLGVAVAVLGGMR